MLFHKVNCRIAGGKAESTESSDEGLSLEASVFRSHRSPVDGAFQMSERKVLNKYFPPEYDPEKFPSLEQLAKKSNTVRLMAPFSMRCATCGEFIYKSKKFNARKENANETYLGIQIFRFYIRCPNCAAEITFKTDPKNTDYSVECGAIRNFEPWKEEKQQELEAAKRRAEEEQANPLKALENKTYDSRREIEIFEALDEIRAINARNSKLDPESVAKILHTQSATSSAQSGIGHENDGDDDEAAIRKAFGASAQRLRADASGGDLEASQALIKGLFKRDASAKQASLLAKCPEPKEASAGATKSRSFSSFGSATAKDPFAGVILAKKKKDAESL